MKKLLLLTLLLMICTTGCAATYKASGNPEKINLVWQANFTKENDDFSQLPAVTGVNVVSPCWFAISDTRGHITTKGSSSPANYVTNLHDKGYKVWPLITNSFNPTLTEKILSNKIARAYVVQQMEFYANQYGFDGYNLDFENISEKEKDKLTAFVQEITVALKKKNLTISMAITLPSNNVYWSKCYDRKALGETVDYLTLMAYDQHHPTSHHSGSTAALDWVENGLQKTMELVPPEKLVLGLPLYTRLWESKGNSTYATGKTLSMPAAEELITTKKLEPQWLEKEGQFYIEYQDKGNTYKAWLENSVSLQLKTELVNKYKLAGIAAWRKGFETTDVWPVLNDTLANLKIKG